MKFLKNGVDVIGDIISYMETWINKDNDDYEVWIGCDSVKNVGKLANYVLVICIYKIYKGAHVVHRKEKIELKGSNAKDINTILERLWKEVEISDAFCSYLIDKGFLKKNGEKYWYIPCGRKKFAFEVHVDYSNDEENKEIEKAKGDIDQEFYNKLKELAKKDSDNVVVKKGNAYSKLLSKAALGLFKSRDIQVKLKPNAWSASYAADRIVRNKLKT